MASEESTSQGGSTIVDSLSAEKRSQLEQRHYVKDGEDLVWIDLDGTVRREALGDLYYLRTAMGVFRVSRLNRKVVEV